VQNSKTTQPINLILENTGNPGRLQRAFTMALLCGSIALAGCSKNKTCSSPWSQGPDIPAGESMMSAEGALYYSNEVIVRRHLDMTHEEFEYHLDVLQAVPVDVSDTAHERVLLPPTVTADEAVSYLLSMEAVESAERNYVVEAIATPNDPQYDALWGMKAIKAEAAWDISTGSVEVLVAVSDTGVDYTHVDLADNAWTNPNEIPDNGIDDDNNGYVDDVYGWDWANGDNDPMDDHYHGTHCAGTVGATGNNGEGVAGVSWTVKIAALKFLTASGRGSLWGATQSILYGASIGADVVSASWGCGGCKTTYIEEAIDELGAQGGLFVAAAGNNASNNDNLPFFPAAHTNDNLVAVAATQSSGGLAWFSNYGSESVDVAAPGHGILSTMPGNNYGKLSGTSMAAPHVSGMAALLKATNPKATPVEIRQALIDSSDPDSKVAGKVVANGTVNLYALLNEMDPPPKAPKELVATPSGSDAVRLSWTAPTNDDLAMYRVRWGFASGVYSEDATVPAAESTVVLEGLESGVEHFMVVHAVDAGGNESQPSNEVSIVPKDVNIPPQIIDLVATTPTGELAQTSLASSSGEASAYWTSANALDGKVDTAWISPPRAEAQEEFLMLSLPEAQGIHRIDLASNPTYPEFFPADFDIETSIDSVNWKVVGGMRGATVGPGEWRSFAFPTASIAFVRIRILTPYAHPSGLFYTSIAEVRAYAPSETPNAIALSFTAPGDDPGAGHATEYDVRYATTPIDESTFEQAAQADAPTPSAAGVLEVMIVDDLAPETTYYFAMKAFDEVGNHSPMSNVAVGTTQVVPPSVITNLIALDVGPNKAVLGWTAPGDDGDQGQASAYDMRYSQEPITPANFDDAKSVPNLKKPAPAGTSEVATVKGLKKGTLYYFAIIAVDDAGASSGLSNLVAVVPQSGPDTTPPASVIDLAATVWTTDFPISASVSDYSTQQQSFEANLLTDGDPSTSWASSWATPDSPEWAVLDLGSLQPVRRFRMHPSTLAWYQASYPKSIEIQGSVDGTGWETMLAASNLPAKPQAWNEWWIPVTYARYLRLYVTERHAVPCKDLNGCEPGGAVEVGELEVFGSQGGGDAILTWVAPGDDNWTGTATAYDVRSSQEMITEDSFDGATSISSFLPQPAGMIEVLPLTQLANETSYYFAVKAIDEAGNMGGLSNIAHIDSPGVAPAAISDLVGQTQSATELLLGWTATGDDGLDGTASAYDIRYLTAPLSGANWNTAPQIPNVPTPKVSGATEAFVMANLEPNTLYYVGIRVLDEQGNQSLISNIVKTSTADGIPPADTTSLQAGPVDPNEAEPLVLTLDSASSEYSEQTAAKNTHDGQEDTLWLSAGAADPAEEYLVFDLSETHRLGRVRLRAADAYQDLFPVDFRLDVQSEDNPSWTTVLSESDYVSPTGWSEWALGAVEANRVRLVVTKTNVWNGLHYASLAEVELYDDPTNYTTMRLSWTAPGDDGDTGVAAQYDIRMSPNDLNEDNFDSGDPVDGAPIPSMAGSLERLDVTDLDPETTYCFALKTVDDANNWSNMSNAACATTPGIPPSTITDLAVLAVTGSSATLTWLAPGDDAQEGQATAYEMRMSTQHISSVNWDNATALPNLPSPSPSGSVETVHVENLDPVTTYYFAIRSIDSAGNISPISNNAQGTTADTVPPSAVVDLAVNTNSETVGSVVVTWTAPGDNGPKGKAGSYDLRISPQPINSINFDQAQPVPTGTPNEAGATESVVVTGLVTESLYYAAVKATDDDGNESDVSNVSSGWTQDEAPALVTDLAIVDVTGGIDAGMTLQWTAAGDDGNQGTATSYEIRYSTTFITANNFSNATLVTDPPSPKPAGSVEKHAISALAPGTLYYVAMTVTDERGNTSLLSNVVSGATPDGVAPDTVSNLTASTANLTGRLNLQWTAPGDDGATGKVSSYNIRWSLATITPENFDQATSGVATVIPVQGGQNQTATLRQLPDETLIYVAIQAGDDQGNWSDVSNTASADTLEVPPAKVVNLSQTDKSNTSVTVSWTAPGDDGSQGTATSYDLRYSTSPITSGNFDAATSVPTAAPQPAGSTESASIDGLSANNTIYVALRTTDDKDNTSDLSNVLLANTLDESAPGLIDDLQATSGAFNGAVVLAWTATGDDGSEGQAASYDCRRALEPVTAANWASATPVTLPKPKAAGQASQATVSGLPGETEIHFAIRAMDEDGNEGPLSASTSAMTKSVAPGKISTLAAEAKNGSVTLTWTATGDDGTQGSATSYDIRYGVGTPIFDQGTTVDGEPTPAEAGTPESYDVTGLSDDQSYWFAIKATDDVGSSSPVSNIALANTPDQTAPAAPNSLTAVAPAPGTKPVAALSADASSALGAKWGANHLIDGDATTAWASLGTGAMEAQDVTIELAEEAVIDRIELRPDASYLQLFPVSFTLAISTNGSAWTEVASVEAFEAQDADWIGWGFQPQAARYVRVSVEETAKTYNYHYALLSDVRAFEGGVTTGEIDVTWVAPGDNANQGTATLYELYFATETFDEGSLNLATLVGDTPAPAVAGTLQTHRVSGLTGETPYYWAMRAIDEADNAGALTAMVVANTHPVPPAAVTDLGGSAAGISSASLSWTAPGDDGDEGTATSYELRYATWPITSQSFPLATKVENMPAPLVAGTVQSVTVTGLNPGATYQFALVARDEVGATSYLSNVEFVTTDEGPDATAPSAISDLYSSIPASGGEVVDATVNAVTSEQTPGFEANSAVDGSLTTMWSTEAQSANNEQSIRIDLGDLTAVDHIQIWPADSFLDLFPPDFEIRVSSDGLTMTTIASESDYAADAGTAYKATGPAEEIRYVEFVATGLATHDNGLFYAVVSEITAIAGNVQPGTVHVSWTATGDDDVAGQAAAYELRVGTCPFDQNTASLVATDAPLPAGNPERYTVTGLDTGQYCAGIIAVDEAGNASELSNIATFAITDGAEDSVL